MSTHTHIYIHTHTHTHMHTCTHTHTHTHKFQAGECCWGKGSAKKVVGDFLNMVTRYREGPGLQSEASHKCCLVHTVGFCFRTKLNMLTARYIEKAMPGFCNTIYFKFHNRAKKLFMYMHLYYVVNIPSCRMACFHFASLNLTGD